MADHLPDQAAGSTAFTLADHRDMHAFRPTLRRHGGRQTIATDYDFSPEVVEIFAAGRDDAAFLLWREPAGIAALALGARERRRLAASTMTECLERIRNSLAASD